MIQSLIGWPLALACLAIAVPLAVRTVRNPQWRRDTGNWVTVLIFSVAAVAALAVAGVLAPLVAGVTGGLLLAAFALVAKPWRKGAARNLGTNAAFGKDWLVKDTGTVWGWLRGHLGRRQRDGGNDGPVPLEAVAGYAATRAIPSVMTDPALGPPPEPAEMATASVPVPAPWAALAQYIGSREPEDSQQLRMYTDGDAAGALAVADAYHAWADSCLNGIRLSPAYVAGVLEGGDSVAGLAAVFAQIYKRFQVIYGAIQEWIGAHGNLPKDGDFLTGED